MRNKVLRLIFTFCIVIGIMSMMQVVVSAAVTSGTCGENSVWAFDTDTKTLTISGTGGVERNSFSDEFRNLVEQVVIEEGITAIGKSTFNNSLCLTSVEIKSSDISIEQYAFYSCDVLTSITITGDRISIGERAFGNNPCLTSVTMEGNDLSIGDRVFYNCDELADINIQGSIKEVGISPFDDTAYYNNEENYQNGVLYIGTALIKADRAISGEYSIKEGTTIIGRSAFEACESLTAIEIPNSVVNIEYMAFHGCQGLTTLKIPGSVTSIGDNAFCNCLALTSVEMLEGVKSIGSYAFSTCYDLKSVEIPDSITSIGERAFASCRDLENVKIPVAVTSIGDGVFANCRKLTIIEVDEGNENYIALDGNLFNKDMTVLVQYACGNRVNEYIIPDGVTSIRKHAFSGSDNLRSVEISDSVKNIGDYAFSGCNNLTSIKIPAGVVSIGIGALTGGVVNIEVNENNENYASVNGNLFNKDKTVLVQYAQGKTDAEYVFPDSVISIGDYAFSGSSYLTSVEIPNNVKNIGYRAFYGCDFTSVKIKSDGINIGEAAFGECKYLTSVEFTGEGISIGERIFAHCDELADIKIQGSVKKVGDMAFYYTAYYANEENWENGVLYIGTALISTKTISGEYSIKEGTTAIADNAFRYYKLASINIPKSVISIGKTAINCKTLTDVYYAGSEDDWKKINIEANHYLTKATIHYNSGSNEENDEIKVECSVDGNVLTITGENVKEDNIVYAVVIVDGVGKATEVDLTDGTDEIVIDEDTEAVKVFIWESIESMKPLCEAVTVE